MKQRFSVSIESPQSGYMSFRLQAGEQRLLATLAHAPYDSLHDLLAALTALIGGAREAVVKCNCEPEELDFRFECEGEEVDFRVVRYQDHRRLPKGRRTVFAARVPQTEFFLAFWRELRELRRRSETDVFGQNWRRQFPHPELQEFNRAVRGFKRGLRAAATQHAR